MISRRQRRSATPDHPLGDLAGQVTQEAAQGGLALVGHDGHEAAGGEAADGETRSLPPEARLVDTERDGTRAHQRPPVAPRHGQRQERPAGSSIVHPTAPPEGREALLAERRQ